MACSSNIPPLCRITNMTPLRRAVLSPAEQEASGQNSLPMQVDAKWYARDQM
jgi:hypothetical protein